VNILYHYRVRGTGAEAVHISGISGAFEQLEHRVRFVSPYGIHARMPMPPRPGSGDSERRSGAKLLGHLADHAPQAFFESMELGYNSVAVPRLLRAASDFGAAFIYERYAFFNAAGAIASRLTGLPLVVEVNELAGYERVRDQEFVRLARAMERGVFKRASLVVTVSDFLSERVRASVGDRVPVATIPNGVSLSWVDGARADEIAVCGLRRRLGLGGRRVVCFVGGLVHWHNFGLLLEATRRVRCELPDVALVLIGEGSERTFVEARARELGLGDSIRLVGAVPHAEIGTYLGLADMAVVPHSNEYRSPIKLFEYMAFGRAVVAPRVPPIEAIVEEGRTGLLFEPGHAGSLHAALNVLLRDPVLAAEMGTRARAVVRRRYTWPVHARRILALLEASGALARTMSGGAGSEPRPARGADILPIRRAASPN
jgi:glycosyltransferase involved in cell wall biosynthesis